MNRLFFYISVGAAVGMASPAFADANSDMIASAESAAPAALAKGATIMGFDSAGMMISLREGTNGWTCMPDSPSTPGPDPMCLDANAMEWAKAWMNKADPPAGKIGFGYMLAGGSDSNTDPFATEKTADNHWVITGPHVMIFNYGDTMSGYPDSADPDPTMPYVMYAGTPYAHLMLPIQ